MDINSLRLHHSSLLGDAETDILTHPWVETLELFVGIDPTYYVYVAFAPVDDPEESIYESFEAPPEIRTFFDLQDSNVKLNSSRIGTRKARVGKYLLQSDINVDPLEEIGAAPEPKVFPSKQEERRYYSGFDVDKEEERRKWQKRSLANLSYNAKAAQLKINALPADLTNGQKNLVTAAQDQMHRAAIEGEAFINKVSQPRSQVFCSLIRLCTGKEASFGFRLLCPATGFCRRGQSIRTTSRLVHAALASDPE
jgi:hypothetical protein